MGDAVESIGLDGSIMNHILKDYLLAHLQLMVETPIAHEVAAQTAVAA